MAVSPAQRLYPRRIEQGYRALIARRIRTIQSVLSAAVEDDLESAVGRTRLVIGSLPVPASQLLRVARQAGAYSSNCAVREVLKRAEGPRAQKVAAARALRTRADASGAEVRVGPSVLKVGAEGLPLPSGKLSQWAEDNAQLITNLSQQTLDDIAVVIETGLREGSSQRSLTAEIQKRFGIARRRASTIARDQVGSLNADVTRDRQTRLGVTHYTWQTAEDERVRPEHAALDGTIRRWDSPHPTEGHPGEAINCRCVALPVLDDIEDEPQGATVTPPEAQRQEYTTEAGERLAAASTEDVRDLIAEAYAKVSGGRSLPAPVVGATPKAPGAARNVRKELFAELALAYEDAPTAEARAGVVKATTALGARPVGIAGAVVEFDALIHYDPKSSVLSGDKVRIVTPGLREARGRIITRAVVEKE